MIRPSFWNLLKPEVQAWLEDGTLTHVEDIEAPGALAALVRFGEASDIVLAVVEETPGYTPEMHAAHQDVSDAVESALYRIINYGGLTPEQAKDVVYVAVDTLFERMDAGDTPA